MEFFEIKVKAYSFYANISKMNTDIYINVGGKKRCIGIIINQSTNETILQLLQFHESCDTKHKLQRGTGTGTVHMMNGVIHFIKTLFLMNVNHIVFSDTSFLSCVNSTRVDLQSFYLALNGATWYESKFGAIPDEEHHSKYYVWKDKLRVYLDTQLPDFDDLMNGVDALISVTLAPIYATSRNLSEFIRKVNKEYDCVMFQVWLRKVVNNQIPFLFDITWKIDSAQFQSDKIRIRRLDKKPQDMFHGGGIISSMLLYRKEL